MLWPVFVSAALGTVVGHVVFYFVVWLRIEGRE
jgi:hypothetical protein